MVRNDQKAQIRLIVLVAPDGILGVTGDNHFGARKCPKKGFSPILTLTPDIF